MNGYKQEGFGLMDTTIFDGKRQSTSVTYLHPIKQRQNLTDLLHQSLKQLPPLLVPS